MDEVHQNTTLQHLKMLGLIIFVGIPHNHSKKNDELSTTKKDVISSVLVAGWQLGSRAMTG